jgi:hypothetical protein
LIVPVATYADAWVEPTSVELHDELAARGVPVWPPDDAAKRFEAVGSAPAPAMNDAALAEWSQQANEVLESLVRGNPSAAVGQLDREGILSLSKVVALNRDPRQAQRVLDTCLLGVRGLLETSSPKQAAAMTRKCRRLAVASTPSPHMHPPPVVALLVAADVEDVDHATVLHIGSTPSGCTARVNGSRVGETPLEVRDLVPGRYAVQVECEPGRPGRAHYVGVEPGLNQVTVDTRFDGAIVTRPVLGLRYIDSADAEAHREGDVVRLVEAVSSTDIVVVSAPDTATLELELLQGTRRAGFARIKGGPNGPTRGDIALAARTLVDGKCMNLATLPATVLRCGNETTGDRPIEDAWPAARMPRGKFISGIALFAAGSASLLTGYVLLGPRARASEDWVHALDAGESSASLQQKWFNMGNGLTVTAAIGGGALVTAMPLALPKRAKTPWWAWLSGGLGVGAAAFSVAYGVTAENAPGTPCSSLIADPTDARSCVNRSEQISVAVLTGATAAPLLTVPLVYLLRPSKSKLAPKVEVSRAGGYVGVRGAF